MNTVDQSSFATSSYGRRHRVRLGLLAALVLASTAAVAVPLADAGAQAPASGTTTTLHLVATTRATTRVATGMVEIDVDRTAAGTVVATDTLVCRAPASGPPRCAVTFNFAHGNLFGGATATETGARGTIVDGTGHYAHATGRITATNVSATKTDLVITLHR